MCGAKHGEFLDLPRSDSEATHSPFKLKIQVSGTYIRRQGEPPHFHPLKIWITGPRIKTSRPGGIFMYIYLCRYLYIHECIHVYIYIYVYIYMCVHMYIYIYAGSSRELETGN